MGSPESKDDLTNLDLTFRDGSDRSWTWNLGLSIFFASDIERVVVNYNNLCPNR